jgi:uncharacterized protein (TIGR02145 family)
MPAALMLLFFSCKKDCSSGLNPGQEGKISAMFCSSAKASGDLIKGISNSGVFCRMEYFGSNGGFYPALSVPSAGVQGLTASLKAGTFKPGSGFLDFQISGIPDSSGTARFQVLVGSFSCAFSVKVKNSVNVSDEKCGVKNIFNASKNYGLVSDIDGNQYKTIEIGSQTWMAENLKTSRYRNGDPIPEVTAPGPWGALNTGAFCWYNNDSAKYDCPYGRLYNWFAAVDARKLCPVGWRIPSDEDWKVLERQMGIKESEINNRFRGEAVKAGNKLKSNALLWQTPNVGTSNESGFSGLPAGARWPDGSFIVLGERVEWWSTTVFSPESSWKRDISTKFSGIDRVNGTKVDGLSVRCLKE